MDFRATWMQPIDPGRSRVDRLFGATLGASGACAASYGAFWAGHIPDLGLTAVVALCSGAGLGALTWGLFRDDPKAPSWWFVLLFGGVVGMLAGAFAAFPLGAIFGAGGGALGGVAAAGVWRLLQGRSLMVRTLLAASTGAGSALLMAMWMAI